MPELPGGDTIGIVTLTPTGAKDAFNQDVTSSSVVWIYGCTLETLEYEVTERETDTITGKERAWAWLPYTPTVMAITNANYLRPKRPEAAAQRDYKVWGLPVVQYDLDGQPDHVWIACEWHDG